MTAEKEREEFLAHLADASEVVSSWPEWKQTLLGGKPVFKNASYDSLGRAAVRSTHDCPYCHTLYRIELLDVCGKCLEASCNSCRQIDPSTGICQKCQEAHQKSLYSPEPKE